MQGGYTLFKGKNGFFDYIDEQLNHIKLGFCKVATWGIKKILTVNELATSFNWLLSEDAKCLNVILKAEYLPFVDGRNRISTHAVALKLFDGPSGY